MPRKTVPLSDVQIRNAKPKAKQSMLYDGDGLFLLISASGSKGWRFKFRLHGKERLMSFGTYPEISLSEAREKRLEARKLVEKGIDPIQMKQQQVQLQRDINENTFQKVAEEWLPLQKDLAESTLKMIQSRLDRDIYPAIGKLPISSIKPKIILDGVIRPMEQRGAGVLSRRVKTIMSQVFTYAVGCEYTERNPTADIAGLLQKVERGHMAAVTDPVELAALLKSIDGYEGSQSVKCALQLLPLLFVRPGELRAMRWQDIDLDAKEWRFVAPKTKTERIVPLSRQSIEILETLRPITGHLQLCFPSIRSVMKPVSNNTFNAAFRRMGYDQKTVTAHGFRATARTILDEVLQQRVDLIEHQLGHTVKDALGRAYNRTSHLPERHRMMQLWSDYLAGLKTGGKVIPLRRNA